MWVFVKVCKGVVDLSMNLGMEGIFFCKSIYLIEVIFIFSVDCGMINIFGLIGMLSCNLIKVN